MVIFFAIARVGDRHSTLGHLDSSLWARTLKGVGKKGKVLSAVHIDDAKSGQMWSAPLHVKETRAKFADQPHQSRLGASRPYSGS
ncbi:hypothetical protein JCM18916_1678 [Cutibacterium acnes JCM 18916]|nr:hypothetical protein JCM18916_1678 [Cutibacterium acnes JCM 18916]